jgi:hypothetical protein
MSTLSNVLSFSRAQAQTDSNGLTDANGIIFANSRLVDFHRQLVASGVDASQIQETYCDAVVPTPGNGTTLAYPTDCLALKTIEVNYQDTNAQNYIRAEQVDVANLPGQNSFSYLRQYASAQAPQFDDRGDWYEVFPAFQSGNNLTQAIRLFYYLKPTEYTATGDTISYPESQDYRILGFGICADYYNSLNKFEEAAAFEDKYQKRVAQYISTLGRGSQQPIQATVLNIGNSGWDF